MAVRVAVVDANVLYSIELTDLLLTLATHRLARFHWSPTIIDEVRRNLAIREDLSVDAIDYRIQRMNAALPDALHEAPATLVSAMAINEHDRHVLALAVHVEADSVITFNLRHFPALACAPHGIEAVGPDDFAASIASADPVRVQAALADITRRRTRPPMSIDQLLDRLANQLPAFVTLMRQPERAGREQVL